MIVATREDEDRDINSRVVSLPLAATFLSQENVMPEKGDTKLMLGGEVVTVNVHRVCQLADTMKEMFMKNGSQSEAKQHEKIMKGAVKSRGLRVPLIKETFNEFYKSHLSGEPSTVQLCVGYRLLSSKYFDEKYACTMVLEKNIKALGINFFLNGDFEVFLRRYIYEWSTCDTFSSRIVNTLLKKDINIVDVLVKWKNLPDASIWMLRCCCVSLVKVARFGKLNEKIIDICSTCVKNSERFVQLGAGWVLRELSRANTKLVVRFLRENIAFVSREGLRYAVEKMPPELRSELVEYKIKSKEH